MTRNLMNRSFGQLRLMLVLVVYDIPDDKRRQRLADFLEGHGRRVQKSVFECFVSLSEMKKLHDQVKRKVKPAEDNVRFTGLQQIVCRRR